MVVRVMAMVVDVRVLVVALFAMEHQKVHAERVEGGDEHTGQYRKVGKFGSRQLAGAHCINDVFLGIET